MVVLLSAFQVACPSYLEKQSFGIIGGSSTEGLIGNVNHNHNHNHTEFSPAEAGAVTIL